MTVIGVDGLLVNQGYRDKRCYYAEQDKAIRTDYEFLHSITPNFTKCSGDIIGGFFKIIRTFLVFSFVFLST